MAQAQHLASLRPARQQARAAAAAMAERGGIEDWLPHHNHYSRALSLYHPYYNRPRPYDPVSLAPFLPARVVRDGADPTTGSSSSVTEDPPADPARGAPLPPPVRPGGDGAVPLDYLGESHVRRKRSLVEEVDGPSRIQVGARAAARNGGCKEGGGAPSPPEPKEILEALMEIPSLARTDLLRAYSSLVRDDHQFRSLLALPMDMRKDWLLMEIGSGAVKH